MDLILLDYLGFYPFIDESVTDKQFTDNTVTLPRYADGDGVQIMPVVVAGQTGGGCSSAYTNEHGESGRITRSRDDDTVGQWHDHYQQQRSTQQPRSWPCSKAITGSGPSSRSPSEAQGGRWFDLDCAG